MRVTHEGGQQRRDPQELDPRIGAIIRAAARQARREIGPLADCMGGCHSVWERQKEILLERGIRWQSPADMNPDTLFD